MNLNKDILSLAIPSILANITVPLVGMADIAVAGHLPGSVSGAAFIGGITIGTMLFDLLYWNFAFLRSGTGGLTAQAYGASLMTGPIVMPDPDRASQICHILHRALRIALISGMALIALQWVILWLAFLFVDCSPEVRELATQYFKIRVWAAPATLSLFAFKGWFIGLQDTVRPMIADLLVNGLNILLSFGLGFGLCGLPRLGFAGVAAGTVIAQWSGFLYAAIAARRRLGPGQPRTQKRPFLFPQRSQRAATDTESGVFVSAAAPSVIPGPDTVIPGPDRESHTPSFFRMNRDLVLRAVGMIAVYIGFTVISARFGDTMLAVSSILMKLLLVFSYFTDGFAYAGEALTGRFIGAKDPLGVKTTIRGCFLWGWGLAGAFMLLYGFGGVPAFRLLTSDMTVVEAGREFIPWLLLMPLIGVPAFIWDGIFTGATATGPMRDSTLLCAVGFFAVWFGGAAVASALNGNPVAGPLAIHILMAAYFTHLAIRSAYLTGKRWKITGCK